jgi:phosphoribosylformylglycinamidine cyclo-ligase
MGLYSKRGVSAQKEEVHAAAGTLDKGLFPKSFCKIFPDWMGGDEHWVNVMHADGAGTKSILAYLYWKETGDRSVWKGIAQDAVVMNLDDLLCVGIYDNLLFSSTIDRNKNLIPGEVLAAIMEGTQEFFDKMKTFGIRIHYMGGETADVGDVVRTIAVNGTMTARWPKEKIITNEKIRAGDVIIGLAGFGQAAYETAYNSGIGSNGLTSARHDVLKKTYAVNFPETFDPVIHNEFVYSGPYGINDLIDVDGRKLTIGSLLLSPTRTYAPFLKTLLENHFDDIHGLVHCSGGGQTKCLKYLPENVSIVKDRLFDPPTIFKIIQACSGTSSHEMYQVFNMGCRMEIYTTDKNASTIIRLSESFGIEAKIIGRAEERKNERLKIVLKDQTLVY